jgi:hypothetical protein
MGVLLARRQFMSWKISGLIVVQFKIAGLHNELIEVNETAKCDVGFARKGD